MPLPDFLRPAKNKLAEISALIWFQLTLKQYGKMTSLQIDSKNKTIRAELKLKGESAPIHVNILRYELFEENDKTYLQVGEIQTSREWMNVLLREYLTKGRLEVPNALKVAL
jgi:hypothetical protein